MTNQRARAELVSEQDESFQRFWNSYPRRVAKKEARKAWAQINPSAVMVEKILAALEWQVMQPTWLKDGGQYIPHPATWLRAERWDDEPVNIPMMSEATVITMIGAAEFIAAEKKNGSR